MIMMRTRTKTAVSSKNISVGTTFTGKIMTQSTYLAVHNQDSDDLPYLIDLETPNNTWGTEVEVENYQEVDLHIDVVATRKQVPVSPRKFNLSPSAHQCTHQFKVGDYVQVDDCPTVRIIEHISQDSGCKISDIGYVCATRLTHLPDESLPF